MELITESATGDDGFYQREAWPLALAFVTAGVVTWFVGKKLHDRSARIMIDKATGQEVTVDASRHTLFFVPMHYWGVILIAIAILPFVLRR